MLRSLTLAGVALAALGATGTVSSAQERSLTFSSGFPEGAVPPDGYRNVIDWLKSTHDIDGQVFSMSLLSFPETPAGIRDGMTDVGYVLTPYFPAEFAEMNMAADMTLLVSEGTDAPSLAMSGALAEYVLLNCEDCQDQFEAMGQVFLGGGASAEYSLVCSQPITEVAQLQGLSIRSGAAVFGRWVEHFGGTKVSIPGSEMYESLSQGVVDCTMVSLPDVLNFQLQDVISDVMVGAPGGVFAGTASMNMNLDLWRSFTDDERRAMLEAGARMTSEVAVGYYNEAIEAETALKDAGISVEQVSDEIATATQDFVEQDIETIVAQSKDIYGIDGAPEKVETVRALISRWKDLVAGIDPSDKDAFTALLMDEVYAKVDPAAYGMP